MRLIDLQKRHWALLSTLFLSVLLSGCINLETPKYEPKYVIDKDFISYFSQNNSNYCGAACMQMYLNFEYTKPYIFCNSGSSGMQQYGKLTYPFDKSNPSQDTLYSDSSNGLWSAIPAVLNKYLSNNTLFNPSFVKVYTFIYDNKNNDFNNQLYAQKYFVDYDEVCIVYLKTDNSLGHAVLLFGYNILSTSTDWEDMNGIWYYDPNPESTRRTYDDIQEWNDTKTKLGGYQTSIGRNFSLSSPYRTPLETNTNQIPMLLTPANNATVMVSYIAAGGIATTVSPNSQIFIWKSNSGSTNYTFTIILPDGNLQSFNCINNNYLYTFSSLETGVYHWYVTDNVNGMVSQTNTFGGVAGGGIPIFL